jgi:hypothetical protein
VTVAVRLYDGRGHLLREIRRRIDVGPRVLIHWLPKATRRAAFALR